MKIEYELISPDEGYSFRMLHNNVKHGSEFVWQYHYHPECEIVYVPKGDGTRHIGVHLSRYEDGDLVLIGANVPHAGFGLHSSGPHEEFVIQFKQDLLPLKNNEFENISRLLEESKYGIAFPKEAQMLIGPKIIAMQKMIPCKKFISLLDVLHTMCTVNGFSRLNKSIISPAPLFKHKMRLQKVFTYVETMHQDEICIKEAARIAGLSVPSFCNFFKKTTNITFSHFVKQYRIQKACNLLYLDRSVAEVCFECGFNNVTYFNKIFKALTRQTPSGFRKQILSNSKKEFVA